MPRPAAGDGSLVGDTRRGTSLGGSRPIVFGLLATFGTVTAFGISGLYIVSYATLPPWFERRLGTAGGVASPGLGVGLVVIPLGAATVLSTLGWRTAMLGAASSMALLAVIAVLLLADDPSDIDADVRVEFGESGPTDADDRRDNSADGREIITAPPFVLVFLGSVPRDGPESERGVGETDEEGEHSCGPDFFRSELDNTTSLASASCHLTTTRRP